MSTPTRTSRKAFAFEGGSKDYGKGRLRTCLEENPRSVCSSASALHYSTPIRPLRADVGVPLARRSGVEDIVQIHVSIGQAF
ncbi:MAG: hypothetical protein ACREXX_20355 [Gammaproteobacteria bacterium]